MALVQFINFSFRYMNTDFLALNKIDLSIEEGEYVLITGPSGCGKTTLCRAINGLVPHFHRGYISGRVVVDGMDTREHSVAEMARKVGIVFQNPSDQLVTLNVEKEIAFGPENLGVDPYEIRHIVEELINRFDLSHLRNKHPHEMSGGEQQRVAMAATLSLRPKILVADEPTSNLDPKSAEQILRLIAEHNREGMTVIMVEHRLDLLARDVSRVVLLNEGRIVGDGPPGEILTSDVCQRIGVDTPRTLEVYLRLRARGVSLPHVPLTPEELATSVRRVLNS